MPQEKRTGFPTPSSELENAFEIVKAELSKKKADWQTINKAAYSATEKALAAIDFTKPYIEANSAMGILMALNLTAVTNIGIELAELHERLARVEKIIEDLKLARK